VKGVHFMVVPDKTYGEIKLAVIKPQHGDNWGSLSPLKGTVWGDLIPEVSGDAVAYARHNYAAPLTKELGPDPKVLLRKISDAEGICRQRHTCAGYTLQCRPGLKTPDCYEAPGKWTEEQQMLIGHLTLTWRCGFYVVRVRGSEFNLTG
jgi:hypothetical protein